MMDRIGGVRTRSVLPCMGQGQLNKNGLPGRYMAAATRGALAGKGPRLMASLDGFASQRTPESPAQAYAALAGLSTIKEPTYTHRVRMRFLARWLCDVAEAAQRGQVAA